MSCGAENVITCHRIQMRLLRSSVNKIDAISSKSRRTKYTPIFLGVITFLCMIFSSDQNQHSLECFFFPSVQNLRTKRHHLKTKAGSCLCSCQITISNVSPGSGPDRVHCTHPVPQTCILIKIVFGYFTIKTLRAENAGSPGRTFWSWLIETQEFH